MERFHEFTVDVIKRFPNEVEGILRECRCSVEWNFTGEIPLEVLDTVYFYLNLNLDEISKGVKGYEGYTELRECFEWYYWYDSMEGMRYGMYPSLEISLENFPS